MLINGVFEGGGIKGLAYIGVMRFLEERGFQFRQVGGTSVGAIFASLIAAGYKSYQLEEIINDFDVNILVGSKSKIKLPKLIESVKKKGLYSLENFEKYIHSLLKYKNKIYFRDLKIGNNYLLKVIVTELKTKRAVVIPDQINQYGFSPDGFLISKAVAMSSCMPIVFSPYKLGNYTFIDGGATNNFPITIFSDSNIPTLGFRLNENSKSSDLIHNIQKKFFKTDCTYNFKHYNIIDIDTLGIKATEFQKGLNNRVQLYLSGYNSMKQYFYQNFNC